MALGVVKWENLSTICPWERYEVVDFVLNQISAL